MSRILTSQLHLYFLRLYRSGICSLRSHHLPPWPHSLSSPQKSFSPLLIHCLIIDCHNSFPSFVFPPVCSTIFIYLTRSHSFPLMSLTHYLPPTILLHYLSLSHPQSSPPLPSFLVLSSLLFSSLLFSSLLFSSLPLVSSTLLFSSLPLVSSTLSSQLIWAAVCAPEYSLPAEECSEQEPSWVSSWFRI